MTSHSCAAAINQPLLILGIERKLLGLSLMIAVLIGANTNRIFAVALFVGVLALAKKVTRRDDRMLQIGWFVWHQKEHYDPIKRQVFDLEIVEEKLEEE